jgi:hypothetical protein
LLAGAPRVCALARMRCCCVLASAARNFPLKLAYCLHPHTG